MAVQETQNAFNSPPVWDFKSPPPISLCDGGVQGGATGGGAVGFAVAWMLHLEYPAVLKLLELC